MLAKVIYLPVLQKAIRCKLRKSLVNGDQNHSGFINYIIQRNSKAADCDQFILYGCLICLLYDTKCHPVPIPPKCLSVHCVLICIQSEGNPVVKVLDFDKIQNLAVKTHDSAMKAVAAKQSGKLWHHLQAEANKIASSLLQ